MKKTSIHLFLIFCICLISLFLSTGCSVGESACYSCGSCASCVRDSCIAVGDPALEACFSGCGYFCAGCEGKQKASEQNPKQEKVIALDNIDSDSLTTVGGE